jgi:putative transcriptional regulator
MTIKNRLEEIISKQNTTMYAVARDSGLNYATVHSLTKGNPKRIDLETIDKICRVLNITIGELFVHDMEEVRATATR